MGQYLSDFFLNTISTGTRNCVLFTVTPITILLLTCLWFRTKNNPNYCTFYARSIGGEISNDGDFLMFEGNRYDRKGFLYKSFVMSAIVSICTNKEYTLIPILTF